MLCLHCSSEPLNNLPVGSRVMSFALDCLVIYISADYQPTKLKILYLCIIISLNKFEVQINQQRDNLHTVAFGLTAEFIVSE